jgi:hypothetical protein
MSNVLRTSLNLCDVQCVERHVLKTSATVRRRHEGTQRRIQPQATAFHDYSKKPRKKRKTGYGDYCAVVHCPNRSGDKKFRFFNFPAKSRNAEQRELWIKAVSRINPDGTPWDPPKRAVVCGEHFVQRKPSTIQFNVDYVPNIFPPRYSLTFMYTRANFWSGS